MAHERSCDKAIDRMFYVVMYHTPNSVHVELYN